MTDFEEDDFGSGGCSEKVTVLMALYATRSAEHTFFFGKGGSQADLLAPRRLCASW